MIIVHEKIGERYYTKEQEFPSYAHKELRDKVALAIFHVNAGRDKTRAIIAIHREASTEECYAYIDTEEGPRFYIWNNLHGHYGKRVGYSYYRTVDLDQEPEKIEEEILEKIHPTDEWVMGYEEYVHPERLHVKSDKQHLVYDKEGLDRLLAVYERDSERMKRRFICL